MMDQIALGSLSNARGDEDNYGMSTAVVMLA